MLASIAMILVAAGVGNAFAASYNQLNAGLDSGFSVVKAGESQSVSLAKNTALSFPVHYVDSYTGCSVNPRLNWDSSQATTGSSSPSVSLYPSQTATYDITGSSTVSSAVGGPYTMNIYATFHKTVSPFTNAVGSFNNMKFSITN